MFPFATYLPCWFSLWVWFLYQTPHWTVSSQWDMFLPGCHLSSLRSSLCPNLHPSGLTWYLFSDLPSQPGSAQPPLCPAVMSMAMHVSPLLALATHLGVGVQVLGPMAGVCKCLGYISKDKKYFLDHRPYVYDSEKFFRFLLDTSSYMMESIWYPRWIISGVWLCYGTYEGSWCHCSLDNPSLSLYHIVV